MRDLIKLLATEENPHVERILETVKQLPFDKQMLSLEKAIAWLKLVHCAGYVSFNYPYHIRLDVNGATLAVQDSDDTPPQLEAPKLCDQVVHKLS